MKTIISKFSFLLYGLSLTVILSLIFFSCQEDEFEMKVLDDSEFLSIQGDMNDPATMMIPENRVIYNKAFERVLSVSSQNGEIIEMEVSYGSEVNISEELFARISDNLNHLIISKKMVITQQYGKNVLLRRKVIQNGLIRLKSGEIEEDDEDRYSLDGNIAQSIMDGMRDYDSSTDGNINDIWDLSTGNFQGQNFYIISGNFTYNGETFQYSIANSCASAGSNDCELNDISSNYTYDEPGGKYFFVIDNIQGLPSVTISTYSSNGFNSMANYLGW